VASDRGHLHDIQPLFKETARGFMAEIVKAQVGKFIGSIFQFLPAIVSPNQGQAP
jgi:hypothetical protein